MWLSVQPSHDVRRTVPRYGPHLVPHTTLARRLGLIGLRWGGSVGAQRRTSATVAALNALLVCVRGAGRAGPPLAATRADTPRSIMGLHSVKATPVR